VHRVFVALGQRLTADDSLYGVRVRGDQRADGKWDPCIEFESRRGIKLEMCPRNMVLATVEALKDWAKRLDERYLLDALARASKGPIRKTRPPRGR
jgi:hypothetical protein